MALSAVSRRELHFRDNLQYADHPDFREVLKKELGDGGMLDLFKHMTRSMVKFHGKVLDLGAGNCWCSALISSMPDVEEVFSLDFSKSYLSKVSPVITGYLKANASKMKKILGDFHELCFKDAVFDFVLFSGSLHHAEDIRRVLNEAKRVLKKQGSLVALREPFCPRIFKHKKTQWGKSSGWIDEGEADSGVNENIYTKQEWEGIFRSCGFRVNFSPFFHARSLRGRLAKYTPLRLLNGILYSTAFVLVAKDVNLASA